MLAINVSNLLHYYRNILFHDNVCFKFEGDGLTRCNHVPFSSPDRDQTSEGCAELFGAGWWLSDCSDPCLNCRYPAQDLPMESSYMHWMASDGNTFNVSKASMKIRRF